LVKLSSEAINKIEQSRAFVEKAVTDEKFIYGLTTGFAANKNRVIAREETAQLQVNLIRSHAIGVGNPFSEEIVRTAMLIRANSLAKGYSGVRTDVINCLIEMINKKMSIQKFQARDQ
jgi:histidine ammonia-lyase